MIRWKLRGDNNCVYSVDEDDYVEIQIWKNSIFVYIKQPPFRITVPLSDFFQDKLKPTPEEVTLLELELGIDFPDVDMYTQLFNN